MLRQFARLGRLALFGAAALMLASCGGSVPPDTYYRLNVGEIAARPGGPLSGTVDVLGFRADGMLNDRSILHREGTSAIAEYNYNFWWQAPGAMLQGSLIDALRRANAFQTIAAPELRLDRAYEILGRVHSFEQDGDHVSVEIELLLRSTRNGAPLLLKTYHQDVPATDSSIPSVVDAFSRAVTQIWADFIADLGTVTVPRAP